MIRGGTAVANKHPNKARNGKAAEPSAEGVYFLSLSLENVRCFGEKQTLDLSDGKGRPARWTILLGDNGTGKTTALQAIALHTAVPIHRRFVQPEFVRAGNSGLNLSGVIATGGQLDRLVVSFCPQPIEVKWFDVSGFPKTTYSVPHPSLFCCGYGASRRLGRASSLNEEEDYSTANLFSYHADLRDAEDWLLRVDYSASKPSEYQSKWQRRRKQLSELLLLLLPEVTDICFALGTGVYPAARVEFKTPYGWVPLRQLGYGYQTLIAWVIDFASRLVERYPDSPNPLAEPAVVLVDEIDLHLHPVWQRKLISDLTERFPNTQFIATAHSPLIVQAAGDANIAVLRREGDHVVIDNERGAVRGWRVDQILTSDLYDLPTAWPPEFDALLKRRKELLTKSKRTTAENRELAKLQKQIHSLPLGESAEQVKTMELLRETLEVLQQKVPPKS